jgi:hypothetical protein
MADLPPKKVIIDLGEWVKMEEEAISDLEHLSLQRGGQYTFVSLRSFEEDSNFSSYIHHPFYVAERTPTDMVRDAYAIVWQPTYTFPEMTDWFEKLVREGYTGKRIMVTSLPGMILIGTDNSTCRINLCSDKSLAENIYDALEERIK